MSRLTALILTLALVSCSTPDSRTIPAASALPVFPTEVYTKAESGSVYQIEENTSFADILVRRGGTLANFGHDHVVSARHISGYLLVAGNHLEGSRADLRLELVSLVTDDPLTRKKFHLDTNPSPSDVQHTIENMQDKVLESGIWPQCHLHLTLTGGTIDSMEGRLTVALHGREVTVPIAIHADEFTADTVRASGNFDLMQSAFGIKPFSVLGGGLRVEDTVEVSYSLVARRLLPSAEKQD